MERERISMVMGEGVTDVGNGVFSQQFSCIVRDGGTKDRWEVRRWTKGGENVVWKTKERMFLFR